MRILSGPCGMHNCCLIFIKLFILTALSSAANAQAIIPVLNPSLEGPVQDNAAPPQWFVDAGQVSVYSKKDHLLAPTDGNTYVIIRGNYNRNSKIYYPGSMGQRLNPEPRTGRTYTFSFDYAYPQEDTGSKYATLIIKGVDWKGQDLLWKSERMYKNSWQRDTIIFTPKRDISFLMFTTFNIPEDSTSTAVVLDNFSDIHEIMTLSISSKSTCPGTSTGSVAVVAAYADSTYTYLWRPGNYTTNVVENLPVGIYRVTVNGEGMTAEAKVEVKASDLNMVADIRGISCYGQNDGMINITAAGGQLPYRYALDNSYNDTGIFSNISPGTYNIQIEDLQQCMVHKTIDILEPPPLQLEKISTKNVICNSAKNGQIILAASGGTPPYTYGIPDYVTQPDSILRRLDGGNYHYTITDSHDCIVEGNTVITKDWRECALYAPNAFTPNGDGINDVFHVKLLDDIHDYRLAVYNRWGSLVFEAADPASGWDGNRCPAGTYLWMVTYTDSKQQLIKQTGSLLMIR
jgi:gliding motility-associated-like protein